ERTTHQRVRREAGLNRAPIKRLVLLDPGRTPLCLLKGQDAIGVVLWLQGRHTVSRMSENDVRRCDLSSLPAGLPLPAAGSPQIDAGFRTRNPLRRRSILPTRWQCGV